MESYLEALGGILPETFLILTALTALVADLLWKGRDSRKVGYLTLVGLFVTGFTLIGQWGEGTKTVFGMVVVDDFGNFFKLFTVGSLAVVVLFVLNDRRERAHGIGEYYFLLLGAAIGAFFMVSTNNLLLLMLGLELLSLASYALAGFHKGDKRSAEASMKYIIFGGLSSGIMVYGISLLYGLTGTLDLTAMGVSADGNAAGLLEQISKSPTPVAIAVVLTLAGFAYKVSIAPFHFWTPDVYEGAPTPVTTFLAVASKAAGFAVLLRFLGAIFLQSGVETLVADYGADVGRLIALLAAVTMTLGNLSALGQTSLKRLLAYSSIAHAGYTLIGVACMNEQGFEAAIYYLAAYYFMNLGAFGFLLYFEGQQGREIRVDDLKGMGWRAPVMSVFMVAFLISLTGIPPTVGFYGKYQLFLVGIDSGLIWLLVVAGLNTAVSLFYYARVFKALFLAQPAEAELTNQPAMTASMVVLGTLTIVFGVWVSPLYDWAASSLDIL